MEQFKADFIKFTEKIKNGENFAYARYADGEVLLMRGNEVGLQTQAFQVDNWKAPNQLTKVGKELLESLTHTESNYYYAIASDSLSDHYFLMERLKTKKENLTFANLWINSNYQQMKEFYLNFQKDSFVICNHKAVKDRFPFKVKELFPFPDNCIEYWENYGDDYISQLSEYVSQVENQTFFISAGPVSELIVHNLYLVNPNNQYIDVGSSLDEFIHGRKTRPYMIEGTIYSNETSKFPNDFYA
jgi:hypothetical protein